MTEKYIALDLSDENSDLITEVLANKTCKKILSLLAEKELSQGDIAKELSIPLNTVDYNINKLVNSGLIEKAKNYFWSVKGKKIPTYKLANKKIIISTKPKFKGIIPTILASGILAIGIRYYSIINSANNRIIDYGSMMEKSADLAYSATPSTLGESASCAFNQITNCSGILQNAWLWFLIGSIVGLGLFMLFNKMKGGFKK